MEEKKLPAEAVGEPPRRWSRLAAFADAAWLHALIGVLAVSSVVLLVAATATDGPAQRTFGWLHALSAAAFFVAIAFWLLANRTALTGMRARDRAWQQSIDSMNVGIALYGPDDRLLNCNAAFRALYPEIGDLLVPGALYSDVVRDY